MKARINTRKGAAWLLAPVLGLPLWISSVTQAQVAAPMAPASRPVAQAAQQAVRTFSNPVLKDRSGADPYMMYRDGLYYLLFTTGNSVEIWASPQMTDWSQARKKVVWLKPDKGPMSNDIWAPEVHWLDGKWYVYVTATDDSADRDPKRRIYVLESVGADIFGNYIPRGQLKAVGSDEYAIDGSIFEYKGRRYFIWSGREKSAGGPQNIYIAPMANPWTLSGPRVLLSTPEFDWEKHGWWVNEGPTILSNGGRNWLVFSASGAATPFYSLGMLELKGDNPLDAKAWVKTPQPVFKMTEDPLGGAYTVGHGSFVRSPDGSQVWNIYHGKDIREDNWKDRTMRADIVRWRLDGSPYFGSPTPRDVLIPVPSGSVQSTTVASATSPATKTR